MKVTGLKSFPLGQAVPNRDHSVCVSLPTVKDLIGYEEKKQVTLSAIKSGYPRFVRHHLITELIETLGTKKFHDEREGFLFIKKSDCDFALDLLGLQNASVDEIDEVVRVQIARGSKDAKSLQAFFQHSGCGISSRFAEDILFKKGLLPHRESLNENDCAYEEITQTIAEAHGLNVRREDILLTSSGANAFYSLFRVATQQARKEKRSVWIRLGWLYIDTIEVMELLKNKDETVLTLNCWKEFSEVEDIFKEHGTRIAGVITEFPTNPLLQCCDLEKLKALCNQYGSLLVVDPTMVSPKNAKVSNHADVVVNSLTKYANWEGDVMMGSLVFPESSEKGRILMTRVAQTRTPPFSRDLLRMAEQIPFYSSFIEKTNANLMQVADFLLGHDKIKRIHWAYQPVNGNLYRSIAGEESPGCVLSFETTGDFETFYNQLRMLKSPSFGTEFTLCCPYVFLAHYRLTKSKEGLETLARAGISPHLCRLSVGLESPEEIIQTLDESLKKV